MSRACRSRWPKTSVSRAEASFYDETGAIRDVIQNHLFQVLANLAMEPPVRTDSESIRDEKVKVLKAIAPLGRKDVVRGQFRGYRTEKGVAPILRTETFAALQFGDRFLALAGCSFLHPGRQVPAGNMHRDHRSGSGSRPRCIPGYDLRPNHFRFRISPDVTIAHRHDGQIVGRRRYVRRPRGAGRSGRRPMRRRNGRLRTRASEMPWPATPTLFAREDYVEEAWRIVDPVLKAGTPVYEYEPRTWGPSEVDQKVSPPGGWQNPIVTG